MSETEETVGFTRMADGTTADYALLARREAEYVEALPDRLLAAVRALEHSFAGYQVSRYEHSLQSATRAQRDGRSDEYIVAALLHDIGDELAPYTHGQMVAAVLSPYVEPRICWIVEHHGVFQQYFHGSRSGDNPDARERYRGHEWFDDCAEFCELYRPELLRPRVRLALDRELRAAGQAGLLRAALPRQGFLADRVLPLLHRQAFPR
jgi:predicted HD phosphohydrolase